MKKYDFFALPPSSQWRTHPLLQDFCKKAQWRAKKLRERGSNTARPTEKCGGGLPIRLRFGRFGRFRRVDSVATTPRQHPDDTLTTPCRHHADTLGRHPRETPSGDTLGRHPSRHPLETPSGDTLWRHPRETPEPTPCRYPSRHPDDTKDKAQTQKKPDSSIGESGSAIARRRAL